jgi:WXXGXW repeat (2 copies)
MRITHSIRTVLFAAITFAIPAASFAQISVGIAIHVAPPVLPVYTQPICPGDGYIWTPGYWAYGDDDYYWVPGTWVPAPRVGVLWTPGYWGWGGGGYLWHVGYWGPHVGFYGGVNYGFGYVGVGYLGGRRDGGHFAYNRAVNNVNVTVIHNTYNTRITNNYSSSTRVSYNGGTGGVRAQESAQERQAAREQHIQATSVQAQHEQAARSDRSQFASVNHGRPNIAATPKPGAFNDRGVVHANAAAASNVRAANSVNSNNTRANTTRTDRPNNASRTNAAQTTNASHSTTRSVSSDRPNNARTNTAEHSSNTRPVQTSQKAAPPPHNSAPKQESKPQAKEHEPHGKP